MTIEQYNLSFNIEIFKSEFKSMLDKYIFYIDDERSLSLLDMSEKEKEDREKRLKSEMTEQMSQMVSITTNSLKLSKNITEVISNILGTFIEIRKELEHNTDIGCVDEAQRQFIINLISELLKSKSQS